MWGLPDPIEPNTLLSRRLLAPAGRRYSQLSIFLPRGCRTEAPCLLPPGPRPAPLSPAVEGTVTAPKDVLVLIPGPCEYVTVCGKWDFADAAKPGILRWGYCVLDYLGGPNVITRVLIRGRQEGQSQRRTCDNRSRGWTDTAVNQKIQAASRNWKRQETKFSLKLLEGMQTLVLACMRPIFGLLTSISV